MPIYDLKDGPKLLAKLEGTLKKRAGVALYSAALRGVQVLISQLIPAATPSPVDRGNYKAGWRVEPHMVGDLIDGADIYNVEPHAVLIERGVRAENVKVGAVMIRALAEWARRKGLEGADTPEGARKAAWAIAMAMRSRGIWGQVGLRILEKLMTQKMPGLVRDEVRAELAAASKK